MIDSWWPFGVLYSQHRELTYPPMTAVRHRISASDDDSIAADKLKQEVAAINSGYSVSLSVPRQSSPNMQPSNTVGALLLCAPERRTSAGSARPSLRRRGLAVCKAGCAQCKPAAP